jgi:hypothetical protein
MKGSRRSPEGDDRIVRLLKLVLEIVHVPASHAGAASV